MIHGTEPIFMWEYNYSKKYTLIEILFTDKIMLLIMIKMPWTVMNSSILVSVVL